MHHLGLTAIEVQFIKVNHLTRAVLDEEIGKQSRELLQQLVVGAGPSDHQRVAERRGDDGPARRRIRSPP